MGIILTKELITIFLQQLEIILSIHDKYKLAKLAYFGEKKKICN